MKAIKLFTVILICNLFINLDSQEQFITGDSNIIKAVRGGKKWGFFANFLQIINHLEWCMKNNFIPVIYWAQETAYYDPKGYNGSENVWEYYFQPVSNLSRDPYDFIHLELYYHSEFSVLWFYAQYIDNLWKLPNDTPIKIIQLLDHSYSSTSFDWQRPTIGAGIPVDKNQKHLYDPAFRRLVKHEIIDKFIRLNPSIQEKINIFWTQCMQGKKTIGIHLRGNFLYNEILDVPARCLLDHANEIGSSEYQYFIATDQQPLLDEASKTLMGPVIYYPFERGLKTSSPSAAGQLTPKDGENVLIEALLLSRCDYLIHTLSQVSTSVLFFNPELPHTLIY